MFTEAIHSITSRWSKRVSWLVAAVVLGAAVYQYAAVWLEYRLMYPSEQAVCQATSLEDSFTRLRQEYAPWMEEATVNCGLPGTINAFN